MPDISKLKQVVTLINTFAVKPENQDELIRVLDAATEEVIRHLPGFVSASLHKSLDGTRVANYAQWTDEAAFKAMLRDERAQAHMAAASKLAERFEPVLYAVSAIHERI